jgi:hypothetical protein
MEIYVKTRATIQRIIEQTGRARAYEPPRHPWMIEQLPEMEFDDGKKIPNPRKQAAIFVVHGMGTQRFPDTAVTLREGFEDTIDSLLAENPSANLPPPFTYEGYWANYDRFSDHFSEEWESFSDNERLFYEKLWEKRSLSVFRTFFWFLRQLLKLCYNKNLKPSARFRYVAMFPTGLIAFVFLLVRYPRVLSHVLGDVRIYLNPRGFIEEAIVQRIERRVGEKFLKLLGLDWNFKPLDNEHQLLISGQPYTFKYVTWIAHSLGSVVSYNVISDILARCEELRGQKKRLRDVDRVERALHRFVTIGSPLEKIACLYPTVLRPWPQQAVERLTRGNTRRWWTNFFHILDPVSGILLSEKFFPNVVTLHSKLARLPLLAHTAYWRDVPILSYVLSRTYGKSVVPANPVFKSTEDVHGLRIAFSLIAFVFFVAVMMALWFGGPLVWEYGVTWVKTFGIL